MHLRTDMYQQHYKYIARLTQLSPPSRWRQKAVSLKLFSAAMACSTLSSGNSSAARVHEDYTWEITANRQLNGNGLRLSRISRPCIDEVISSINHDIFQV